MASHQLAIAKASFSAGLLRPDPTSLSREDIARFHSLLNAAVIQCTPINVQKCKRWILENIVQSTTRFTALGKYLMSLSASFSGNAGLLDPKSKREPSIKRKRLHLLYIINDLLYHAKYRINDASICGKVQPILMNLLGSAASFKSCPKHQKKIVDLLTLWWEKDYYSKDYIEKLREAVKNASELGVYQESASAPGDQETKPKTSKSAPFVMPAMHGDTGTPWFDLPAGNLMPHIVPNSTRPINPDLIKPLQFVAGPADEGLVLAVKALLDDVQKIFGGDIDQDEKVSLDIDELGQPIILDEITGEVLESEGYYGWSRGFCEKMKRRRKGLDLPGQDENQGRRSRSRSSSPDKKRRRYNQSDDGSRSPSSHRLSRPRGYSSSSSRSRSPLPRLGLPRSRSRSKSYSRSPSPRRHDDYSRDSSSVPTTEPPQGLPPKPFHQGLSYKNGFNSLASAQPPPPPPPPGAPPPPIYPPQHQQYGMPPNLPPNMPYSMGYSVPPQSQQHYGSWAPPQPSMNTYANPPWPPPPPPPGPPPFRQPQPQLQQQTAFPPPQPGPGGWMQPNISGPGGPGGPGGWQPPMQPNNGRGGYNNNNNNNNGWNNGQQARGGRGNYRGRGW